MCGVYRNGGSGYGGPAADEKFFDPERVIIKISYYWGFIYFDPEGVIIKISYYLDFRDLTHSESWGYLTI